MKAIFSSINYSNYKQIICIIGFNILDGQIGLDFNFMESFIAELEAQRIAELEAYLSVTGLKDTNLSVEEEKALKDFDKIQWHSCKIGGLFERVKT